MRIRALAVMLVMTACGTSAAHMALAQNAMAEGLLTDTWGNPLEGVEIEARRADGGGAPRTAETDDDGEFRMMGMDSATYEFTYRIFGYVGARQIIDVSPGRRRGRLTAIELELDGSGLYLQEELSFEAEGGTPSVTLKSDGMFEFEDAEGEGEGNYSIEDLSAILTVRDYDGPDDKYSIAEPVVVTTTDTSFMSLAWGETSLARK